MSEQKDEKVGAFWTKTSSRGEFMTGNIELKPEQIAELQANGGKLSVVVFPNERKTGKQPDWAMFKARPRADAGQRPGMACESKPMTDEDVPFAWLLPLLAVVGSMMA
jgi:hypothetical protein